MSRAPNQAIGEVECPHKNCTETCRVFKFRQASESGRTRYAGKLYGECPKHGRFGTDATPAMQEYILEHAKIANPADRPQPAAAPAPKPAASRSSMPRPSSSPPSAPAKATRPWYLPIIGDDE